MDALANFYNVFDGTSALTPDALLDELLRTRGLDPRPWVLWISRPVALGWRHIIPPSATLSFAPGAVLTITGRLTVLGDLDAGLEARFALLGSGLVELLGPLDEIAADWWRPTEGLSPVEHALNALWTRYAHASVGVLPAPIRLDGPYALNRTLRIKPSTDVPAPTENIEVHLQGQWRRDDDPPTFVVGPDAGPDPLSALVVVEEGVVLTADHVAFDAGTNPTRPLALACLSLEGTFHGTRVEACSFRFTCAGLRVIPRLQHWLQVQAIAPDTAVMQRVLDDAIAWSTRSPNRLELSRCVLTGASDEACAVDVGFSAPTSLAVRDSQFVGTFASGVSILGGDVDVTGCQFASDTQRVSFYDRLNATADIVVRRWGDTTEYYQFAFAFKRAPSPNWLVKGTVDVRRDQALVNTHVTITHCVSTSPVFLVMHQTFAYWDTVLGGAMLTNVHHHPAGSEVTSIHLGAAMPSRGLMLQGCRLAGAVYVEPSTRDDVVLDLGTTFVSGATVRYATSRWDEAGAITLSTPRRWSRP